MKRLRGGIMSLLAGLLAMSTTGCMIGPTNNENIGGLENKIGPAGFVLEGDMLIEVQAFHVDRQRFETVATTTSARSSNSWDGSDWYFWQTPRFTLPNEYWGQVAGKNLWAARIRAAGDGVPLYTFNDWNLGPLTDMAAEVNGTEVVIFGHYYYVE